RNGGKYSPLFIRFLKRWTESAPLKPKLYASFHTRRLSASNKTRLAIRRYITHSLSEVGRSQFVVSYFATAIRCVGIGRPGRKDCVDPNAGVAPTAAHTCSTASWTRAVSCSAPHAARALPPSSLSF